MFWKRVKSFFFVDSFCLLHADAQGSDNPIPLSPQWLLPKPGESKPGVGTGVWYHNLFTVLMIFYHQNLLIHGPILGFYIIFLRWIYSLAVIMQSMQTLWCDYFSLQFNPLLFVLLMGYTGKQPASSLWQSLR